MTKFRSIPPQKMKTFLFCISRNDMGIAYAAYLLAATLVIASCKTTSHEISDDDNGIFEKAMRNATLANEGFIRCENYMEAWLAEADPETKLVPRRLSGPDKDIWNAQDCAADNYPFLVLTSF